MLHAPWQVSIVGNLELASSLAGALAAPGSANSRPPVPPTPSKRQRTSKEHMGGDAAANTSELAEADAAAEGEGEEEAEESLRLHPLRVRVVLPLPAPPMADDGTGSAPAPPLLTAMTDELGEMNSSPRRSLHLEVCCIPAQSLLAVSVIDPPKAAAAGSETAGGMRCSSAHLAATLFVNLLESDTGTSTPPPLSSGAVPAQQGKEISGKEILLALLPSLPFKWVQMLGKPAAALDARPRVSTSSAAGPCPSPPSPPLDLFGHIVDALLSRISAADALAFQLSRLASLDPSLPASLARPLPAPPAPPVSTLVAWRDIELDDLPAEVAARLQGVPATLLPGRKLYQAELKRGQVVLGITFQVRAARSRARKALPPRPRPSLGPTRQFAHSRAHPSIHGRASASSPIHLPHPRPVVRSLRTFLARQCTLPSFGSPSRRGSPRVQRARPRLCAPSLTRQR